jgi:hypothetical protein
MLGIPCHVRMPDMQGNLAVFLGLLVIIIYKDSVSHRGKIERTFANVSAHAHPASWSFCRSGTC